MYIVLEIQKNQGQVATLTNQYTDILDAESKYHLILASASKSSVEVHTAMIITEYGFVLKQEHYEHTIPFEFPEVEEPIEEPADPTEPEEPSEGGEE